MTINQEIVSKKRPYGGLREAPAALKILNGDLPLFEAVGEWTPDNRVSIAKRLQDLCHLCWSRIPSDRPTMQTTVMILASWRTTTDGLITDSTTRNPMETVTDFHSNQEPAQRYLQSGLQSFERSSSMYGEQYEISFPNSKVDITRASTSVDNETIPCGT